MATSTTLSAPLPTRRLSRSIGCYLAAKLAPRAPMRHALILGAVGTVIALAGVLATFNHPEMGPNWYPILLVITAFPCAYLGGLLERRLS